MDINNFLESGIIKVAASVGEFYKAHGSAGRRFARSVWKTARESSKKRAVFNKNGTHIPPFLIVSVTSSCNLKCRGCYSRADSACTERGNELSGERFGEIFAEAANLGVMFALLAGGEPLMRKDVLSAAAVCKDIIFPVFTNGTLFDDDSIEFFARNRNLIPVLSAEGDAQMTDERRGGGVSQKLAETAREFAKNKILYGVSLTVTSENMSLLTDPAYIATLRGENCAIIFFIEYVPAEKGTENLVLSDEQIKETKIRIDSLRTAKENRGMLFLSFPGDEDEMGGCLAAGRGFFHINPRGGAEPCPFSPFSAVDLQHGSLLDAIRSPFFARVREIGAAAQFGTNGGCALYSHKEEIEALTVRN